MKPLGKRTLREIELALHAYSLGMDFPGGTVTAAALLKEVRRALKTKRSVKAARVRRVAKKRTKREEMAELRADVFARSGGRCEVCGAEATDLEHAFGRVRVKQAPSNCLSVCRPCHVARTNLRPSAFHWWAVYAGIFVVRGDVREAKMATDMTFKSALRGRTGEQT